MVSLSTYRLLLFSTLALLLALIAAPARRHLLPDHPLCRVHPVLRAVCSRAAPAPLPRDVVNLTLALAAIPSVSGAEQPALIYARRWLAAHGWHPTTQPVPALTAAAGPRFNVLAVRRGASLAAVRVVFTTHLDTVPGAGAARPGRDGPRLRGRGVVDAKGQAAGMMLAATAMADPRVAVLLVCGEEVDHAGMRAAAALRLEESVVLVNGEPTESRIGRAQKGMVKVVVRAEGKAAHSGYPQRGESAVHKLVEVLTALREVQWPVGEAGATTMNVGIIRGGIAPNVVAAEAEAEVMFRLVGEVAEVMREVERVVARFSAVSVEVLGGNAPVAFLVPEKAGAELGVTNVAYNTDVPYYGAPVGGFVLFGAGSIESAHGEEEWVDIEELEALPGRLQDIATELLHTQFLRGAQRGNKGGDVRQGLRE